MGLKICFLSGFNLYNAFPCSSIVTIPRPFCPLQPERLPTNLITLRQNGTLSQTKIAEYLGISKSCYKRYEMGKSIPPLNRLVELANLFGVTVDELVERDKQ